MQFENLNEQDLRKYLSRISDCVSAIEIYEEMPYNPENQENFERNCIDFFRDVQSIISTAKSMDIRNDLI